MVITHHLGAAVGLEIALELGPSLLHGPLPVTGVPRLRENGTVRSGQVTSYRQQYTSIEVMREHRNAR